MPQQIIRRVGPAKFEIFWLGVPNSKIQLDFNPVIEELRLQGDFLLRHWQARPVKLRRFGFYHSLTDTYTSHLGGKLPRGYEYEEFQLDESIIKTKPTAVIIGVKPRESD